MLYLKPSRTVTLIVSAIIAVVIFVIKFILWFIHFIANKTFELTGSTESGEDRPSEIPDEIWSLRKSLVKELNKPSLDAIVNDCISSGIDVEQLLHFIDELNAGRYLDVSTRLEQENESYNVISVCGKLIHVPFSREDVNILFPSDFTLPSAIFATIFAFVSSVLATFLSDQMLAREKWWIAVVCAFGFYSILQWPSTDPYMTSVPDCWNSSARSLAVSIVCAIWYGTVELEKRHPTLTLPFSYWSINMTAVAPYIDMVCRYGLMLMPFWFILGYFGHPVTVIVTIVEAFNRYAFGQNGVSGLLSMIVQFLRGSITVVAISLLLHYSKSEYNLCIALTIATFMANLPLHKAGSVSIIYMIFLPIIATGLTFVMAYVVVFHWKNSWEIVKWLSFGWFILIDVLIPILTCNHKYFFFHLRFFRTLIIEPLLRAISSYVIAPLFIASCLQNQAIDYICLAFIITHAIHKSQSESHVFAFVIAICVLTFEIELGFTNRAINLALTLLIVTKFEVFLPLLDLTYHARDPTDLDDEMEGFESLLLNILFDLIQSMHFIDFLTKIPSMLWSFFTGSSYTAIFGLPYFLLPAPLRPYYFFNWPMSEDSDLKALLTKGAAEHPVETPVYISACRALTAHFANICKQGRLGLVNAGDIFLFKSSELAAYVHVIAIEPDRYKIQLRGLEYNNQTSCHRGEARRLEELISNYEMFPNFEASKIATHFVVDIRAMGVPLEMYDITKTKLNSAFVGASVATVKLSFLYSFAHIISKNQGIASSLSPFETTDQEILRQSEEYIELSANKLPAIFELYHFDYTPEEFRLYQSLWTIIATYIFNQNGILNYITLFDGFKGNIQLNDDFTWVYNSSDLMTIIQQVIQYGTGFCYMASAGMFNDESTPEDIYDFIEGFEEENVVTNMDSELFHDTFIENKKKIISLEKINGETVVMRFALDQKNWNVYQMKHEWMRAIYSNETKSLIFFQNDDSERFSIQHNSRFFNNMIVQSCDFPVGYPAYVSEILSSNVNYLEFKKYEVRNDE
ncbi:pecanex protein 1 [Histomonas meleagridis]|uniref:pecanex protein 1 n=1 Tax=Histomonas meleagridis TaxID=135588 RepID=UPI00355A7DD5|nr:pecanex protein 1 [Histomonas meleagridis]KAH0806011.1 pecanex protein 1 [Histomonas meleagridis]